MISVNAIGNEFVVDVSIEERNENERGVCVLVQTRREGIIVRG